jgi:hypothetical protein
MKEFPGCGCPCCCCAEDHVKEGIAEIGRLRAAQWPAEATPAMKTAVYALNLGHNRLSEDDVIDIYDTFLKCVIQQTTPKTYTAGNGEELPEGSAGTTIINDGRPV